MDASGQNYKDTFRYTDVEYTPDGHTDVYRWDDFLGIAGGHVYSAMDTIDMVSTGGQYEGDEPEHAYACEVVGCCGLSDGVALFRPVSHDGADLIQIAFLRNDVDDATGAYTERFEAGSFDLPAADLPRSESRVDLLEYFSGRSFKHTPGVNRGLDPREAVDSIEDAIGCDLGLFDGFWLGVPGEADMRVGPYTKKSLLDFSYYAKEDGISVGIDIPGGKCADIAFVDADPDANDLYPTPVRAFTYNGRDEEPDHRTDVHLDGDMVLEGQLTAEAPAHLPGDVAAAAKEAAAKSVKPDTVGTDGIKH